MKDRPLIRLIRQSGLYAIGNVAIKLTGLLLAPFFLDTSYLSLVEYGQLSILLIFAQLAIGVIGLGLSTGLLRYVGKEKKGGLFIANAFTAFACMLLSTILAFSVLYLNASSFSVILLDNGGQSRIIELLAIYVCCKVLGEVPKMLLRIDERAGVYAFIVVIEMVSLVVGIYFLLVYQGLGLTGIIAAYALASAMTLVLLVFVNTRFLRWTFKASVVKPLLRFGLPLILVGISGTILHAGDRFILKAISGAEEVGMYEWAARMSGVLNLFVVQSFQLAFTVIGLKTLRPENGSFHRQVLRHYIIWAGWVALGISVLSYELTLLLSLFGADTHYLESANLVLPLTLGVMVYGIYVIINNVLYATSQTTLMSRNVALAAAVNIIINFCMIPFFGAWGAAVATLISYIFLAWLSQKEAQKTIKIDYSWGKLGSVLLIITALYVISYLALGLPDIVQFVARALLLLSYIPLMLVSGLYSAEDLRSGQKLLLQYIKHK